MHLLPAAGPRSAPLAWPVRLVALAWVQLAALVFAAVAAVASLVMLDGLDDLWCFDRARPACEMNVAPGSYAVFVGLQLLIVAAAVAAVATAHRHRRGAASRAAVITTLAAAFVLAAVVDGAYFF